MRKNMQETVESDPGYGNFEERVKDKHQDEYFPYANLALPIDRIPEDI